MYVLKPNKIYASEIAEFLNSKLVGKDFIVTGPSSLENIKENTVVYAKENYTLPKGIKSVVVICKMPVKGNVAHIKSENPRLDFIRTVSEFFVDEGKHIIDKRAVIEDGAVIGHNVAVGVNAYIGSEVRLGDNTIVGKNVVISGQVDIGKNCVIKDNATIGSEGFGFEYDDDDIPQHFPQIGKIIIGSNVWVGSNSTIERPAMDATIIEDHVKIDDLVQIGHNCVVGKGSLITAGTILCGGVKIGKKCWISPNVTIIQKTNVGDGALVGMGAVVIRDVKTYTVVAGNPARLIRELRKERKKNGGTN
jgi:UDP-3-O-[3-hydroxymyristoyl] glucosamine N-acyltransferase